MEKSKKVCNVCGEWFTNKRNHNVTKEHKYWKKIDDMLLHNEDIIQFISSDLGKYKSNVIIDDVQTNKTNSTE